MKFQKLEDKKRISDRRSAEKPVAAKTRAVARGLCTVARGRRQALLKGVDITLVTPNPRSQAQTKPVHTPPATHH